MPAEAPTADTPRGRVRRGFTTMEVLVAVGIVAILAAATVPAIRTRLATGDADAIVAEFQNLEQALQAFQENTTTYPHTLAQLSQLSTTTTSCNTAMSATQISRWRGPYVTRPISASYTVAADVTVENTLVRDTTPGVGLLDIKMDNVEQDVANQVERELDGAIDANSSTTGGVLWATSSGTLVTLTFRFPVRGC
jgi:prepilin-type N-terminal cleavage/methylation domain-containing protein